MRGSVHASANEKTPWSFTLSVIILIIIIIIVIKVMARVFSLAQNMIMRSYYTGMSRGNYQRFVRQFPCLVMMTAGWACHHHIPRLTGTHF